jgi:hypothetical protein
MERIVKSISPRKDRKKDRQLEALSYSITDMIKTTEHEVKDLGMYVGTS